MKTGTVSRAFALVMASAALLSAACGDDFWMYDEREVFTVSDVPSALLEVSGSAAVTRLPLDGCSAAVGDRDVGVVGSARIAPITLHGLNPLRIPADGFRGPPPVDGELAVFDHPVMVGWSGDLLSYFAPERTTHRLDVDEVALTDIVYTGCGDRPVDVISIFGGTYEPLIHLFDDVACRQRWSDPTYRTAAEAKAAENADVCVPRADFDEEVRRIDAATQLF